MSHFTLMIVHATLLSTFFALLSREATPRRWRLFGKMMAIMVGGGILLAWFMYFFPAGPPAPIP